VLFAGIVARCSMLPAIFSVATPSLADVFGTGANQFTIDFVTVGNPGNPADTRLGANPPGAVDYVYRIGKFEISRDMVEKANAEGELGITLHPMDFVTGPLGDGPRPGMPATGVSWNEAARFVNWLNASEGFPTAYKFATQPGDADYVANENILLWEPTDAGYDAANLFRNSQAQYFLPSNDEWHKAAFYDPDANGGSGDYWYYPTGSDSAPAPVDSGNAAGTAVWNRAREQGPAAIMLAGGLSPYGVMGQAGNIFEWEETEFDFVNDAGSSDRWVRGGEWKDRDPNRLSAIGRWFYDKPTAEDYEYPQGFRVASMAALLGDFNGDGTLTASDIDDLTMQSAGGQNPGAYDLNGDNLVNVNDVNVWIRDLYNSYSGDLNLDKQFNSGDLVDMLAAGLYETGQPSKWSTGDFNGDGVTNSGDLIEALGDGGYEMGPRGAVSAVPEPSCGILLTVGILGLCRFRRSGFVSGSSDRRARIGGTCSGMTPRLAPTTSRAVQSSSSK
jgi:hypothetical protein